MLDHKTKLISYLYQYREEVPLWLKNYTIGSKVNFSDVMSGQIGYYPGSEYDGTLIEIGNRSHTIHSFLYVDYLLPKSDLIQHLARPNSIYGYHSIGRIEWQEKDIIPNGPYVMHLNRLRGRNPMAFEPEQPYCFTEILERDDNRDDSWGAERFAITFLCADGIAAYLQLFCGEYKKAPWLVLLQDHGFGCNYDKFGKGGILDEIIEKSGIRSQYVLCADNTHIWDGYTKIENIPPISGGMHRHSRFLYKLSEPGKRTTMNVKINDFEVAHKSHFATALDEVKRGCKLTHWMWYIFPQIYGLGKSNTSNRYAICSLDEAKAFAEHHTLGENLRNISGELLHLQGVTASQIFGDIDAQKLQSSMTLFDAIYTNSVYGQVLDKYFNGERDKKTLCRLTLNDRVVNALNYIGVEAKDFNIVPGMYSFQRTRPTHRFSHIYRVMISTALIAHKIKEPRLGLLAFIAAFIHDLARENDGHDPQHGRRAAQTKLPKLTHLLSKYNITPEEYDIITKASTYHSEHMQYRVSDECFKTCKILSDADALDRCRFENREARLDVSYLHFNESRSCITPIDFICKESVRQGKIYTEIPFEEFIKVAQF